jgi:hypothetical protein
MSDYRLFQVFDVMREGATAYRGGSEAVATTASGVLANVRAAGDNSWMDGVFDTFWGPALQRANSEFDTSERHAARGAAMDLCTDAGEACSAQSSAIAAAL